MKMLICHDGSPLSQSGMEKAIAMFRGEKPEIILVTVVEEPVDASSHDEAAFEESRERREAEIKAAAGWVVKLGLDVSVVVAVGVGESRKMLVTAVKKKQPDLVVITSRPPAGGVRFGRVTVSVSDYLIHHIFECPVLVMH